MPANHIRLEELFDKYVRGNITAEEFNEFWRLVKDMQDSDTLSTKLTTLWQEWETLVPPGSVGPDRSKVFNRIIRPHRVIRWPRLIAAATIGLAIVAGLYLLNTGQKKPATSTPSYAAQPQHTDYTRHLTLPDGSTVVLHAGSTLDYPATFPDSGREVTLKGEAYFDVIRDNKKPFVIHTGRLRTIVLGTAFNISSDSNKITISVTGGKVRVENGKKVLAELVPNQQIVYKVPEDSTVERTVNAEQVVTNWTKQDMIFDGDSFGDIAEVIGKRYGVTIRFKNPQLAKCLIVASFSGTEPLENVLGMLCTIRNASYTHKQDNGEIEIDGKSCE